MKISVFTPSHNPVYIEDCYQSLKSQTFQSWNWILLLNNSAKELGLSDNIVNDPRVNILRYDSVKGVGEAKRICCDSDYAKDSDILVELDHDDLFHPDCLEEVKNAFINNPNAVFVSSNFTQVNKDLTPNYDLFSSYHGWSYRDIQFDNKNYKECIGFKPLPHNVAYIWYAPNHVRAFKKDSYLKVGGYNSDLQICDDQDLMCRLFIEGEFIHIDKCLYFQRIHENNSQKIPEFNQKIQSLTVDLYCKYINDMCLAWSKRNNLLSVDMGAAHRPKEGYKTLDLHDADFIADANGKLPFEDNSVGVIRAVDFLEHIENRVGIWNEIYRVLAHGGMILSMTPSTDGRGAFQDPTHVSFYNQNSFLYYTDSNFKNFVPEINCRFQKSYLETEFLNDWGKLNNIPYVIANLIAIKNADRIAGELKI